MEILNKIVMVILCLTFCVIPIVETSIQVNATEVPGVSIGPDGRIDLKPKKENLNSQEKVFAHVIGKYKNIMVFFSGLATITFVGIFIKHFIELAAKSTNPFERKEIIRGLLWSGIAVACCGSITFVISVLYNLLD